MKQADLLRLQRAFKKAFYLIAGKLGSEETMKILDQLPTEEIVDLMKWLDVEDA